MLELAEAKRRGLIATLVIAPFLLGVAAGRLLPLGATLYLSACCSFWWVEAVVIAVRAKLRAQHVEKQP